MIARAVATARESHQLAQLSESLSIAATAEGAIGDFAAARRFLDEAEAMTAALHDYPATIELVLARAIHAVFQGDMDRASAMSSEGDASVERPVISFNLRRCFASSAWSP